MRTRRGFGPFANDLCNATEVGAIPHVRKWQFGVDLEGREVERARVATVVSGQKGRVVVERLGQCADFLRPPPRFRRKQKGGITDGAQVGEFVNKTQIPEHDCPLGHVGSVAQEGYQEISTGVGVSEEVEILVEHPFHG
jgi:hypothetical protein